MNSNMSKKGCTEVMNQVWITSDPAFQDYLYIIYNKDEDLIKIGRSKNPILRYKQIKRSKGGGESCILMFYIKTPLGIYAEPEERKMHCFFSDYYRKQKEWFSSDCFHDLVYYTYRRFGRESIVCVNTGFSVLDKCLGGPSSKSSVEEFEKKGIFKIPQYLRMEVGSNL